MGPPLITSQIMHVIELLLKWIPRILNYEIKNKPGIMCTQHLQAFMDIVRSSKLSKPKTTKDHRSLPHKSLVNSAPVLLTDHLAPTSEFSAEEEEEEVNSSSTSRGDLDSDPGASLLSPVLIRQQAAAAEEEEGCSCQQEVETK